MRMCVHVMYHLFHQTFIKSVDNPVYMWIANGVGIEPTAQGFGVPAATLVHDRSVTPIFFRGTSDSGLIRERVQYAVGDRSIRMIYPDTLNGDHRRRLVLHVQRYTPASTNSACSVASSLDMVRSVMSSRPRIFASMRFTLRSTLLL